MRKSQYVGKRPLHLAVRFLHAIGRHTSALLNLKKLSEEGVDDASKWAQAYGLKGTWVEEWANSALRAWRASSFDAEHLILPPPPQMNAADVNDSVEIHIRELLEWRNPTFTLDSARRRAHAQVDETLKAIESPVRSELQKHGIYAVRDVDFVLRYAVLYLFEKKTYTDLSTTEGAYGERTGIGRHVKRLLAALELEPRKRGRPRKSSS